MSEKNLPYPLNANPTTDEDRYAANADRLDLAALAARVAIIERDYKVPTPPSIAGAYVLLVTKSGSSTSYAWADADEYFAPDENISPAEGGET